MFFRILAINSSTLEFIEHYYTKQLRAYIVAKYFNDFFTVLKLKSGCIGLF